MGLPVLADSKRASFQSNHRTFSLHFKPDRLPAGDGAFTAPYFFRSLQDQLSCGSSPKPGQRYRAKHDQRMVCHGAPVT